MLEFNQSINQFAVCPYFTSAYGPKQLTLTDVLFQNLAIKNKKYSNQ